jgi:hypothetical protein
MLGSKLRSSWRLPLRVGCRSLGRQEQRVLPTTSFRCLSTSTTEEKQQHFQELGYLDKNGLTVFDTLHEMQVRSCAVYADNDLFGTYDPQSKQFVYESFHDYAHQIDKCRVVLKDLGEYCICHVCMYVCSMYIASLLMPSLALVFVSNYDY